MPISIQEHFSQRYGIDAIALATPVQHLLTDIRAAASELEGQGEKSDRIATQLLTALAKFARETDMP